MSSIADVIATLDRVLHKIRDIGACLQHASETWAEATDQLRPALAGSTNPDVEAVLAHWAATEQAFNEQIQFLSITVSDVEGIISRLRGERGATPQTAPAQHTPPFGSPAWVAHIGQRIAPSKTKVTTGIGFDSSGNERVTLTSGRDELAAAAQDRLVASKQYPKPPGWRPGMLFAAAEHAETKHAVWMRTHGIPHITVIINHPRVCGPPYGCEVAVRTILPRGWTMTVISSASGQRWTLRGVAEE